MMSQRSSRLSNVQHGAFTNPAQSEVTSPFETGERSFKQTCPPKDSRSIHLLVIEEPESQYLIPLQESVYSVGRSIENSITLHDDFVSRRTHATLVRQPNASNHDVFWVYDGDSSGVRSTNGLLVNHRKVSSVPLKHHDTIHFSKNTTATYYKITRASDLDSLQARYQMCSSSIASSQLREEETRNSETDQMIRLTSQPDTMINHGGLMRLASFPELSPHPIVEINLSGEITYLNPAAMMVFENLNELGINHPILKDLLPLYLNEDDKDTYREVLTREIQVDSSIYEQYAHYLPESQLIRSYIYDFTERKQIEFALRDSEERYRSVVRQVSEGIFLVDTQTKRFLEANDAYCQLLGYTHAELLALTLEQVVDSEAEALDATFHPLAHPDDRFYESLHLRRDGTPISVEVSFSTIQYGEVQAYCFVVRDITGRKQVERSLRYQAFYDQLTELPNRHFLNQTLANVLESADPEQDLIAVMFLDLDRFKKVNDTLGHAIGDCLLRNVARRLQGCLRNHDLVARWGGDEFIVLLPQLNSAQEAQNISKRILEQFKSAFNLQMHQLYMRTSIGIALYPQDGHDAETLLKHADSALFRTKEQGRNNFQFYAPVMTSRVSSTLELENSLYQAMEREEFLLYYQPQYNLITNQISGMEALLRWQHPKRGILPPTTFIPLAEEMGLMIQIGEWVIQEACQQYLKWQKMGLKLLKISVNLSTQQVQQSNLLVMVSEAIERSQLAPGQLELEITESSLMDDMEFARVVFGELHHLGVHLSMDDFGVGYSSLTYLKNLPFHTLKIDRSFVQGLKDNSKDLAILAAAVALGRGLGLRVVAEGVETEEQLKLLRNLECAEVQGYLISRPLSANKATEFLRRPEVHLFSRD